MSKWVFVAPKSVMLLNLPGKAHLRLLKWAFSEKLLENRLLREDVDATCLEVFKARLNVAFES